MDKNASVLPISIVTQITQLTPRQIRYYEQQGLISPTRSTGKQKMFSSEDIEQLVQIKELIGRGLNIAGVKEMLHNGRAYSTPIAKEKEEISEEGLRELLQRERLYPSRSGLPHLTHGDLSRFYQKNNR